MLALPFKTNFHVSLMDKEGSDVTVRRLGHERKELDWVKGKGKVYPRTGHEGPEG